MRAKVTKRLVESIKPAEHDQKVWDTEVPGFGVKVTPSGRRVYVLQYWAPGRDREKRTYTLGAHGMPIVRTRNGVEETRDLTAELARALAREARADIQRGADPAGAKARARRALKDRTLAVLSVPYLEEQAAKRKASTAAEYARIFKVALCPELGTTIVEAIHVADVATLHHKLRKTPIQANRTIAVLGAFLNWCAKRGYRARGLNPCSDVERYAEHARERFLTGEELARLGDALRTAETTGLRPAPRDRKKPKSEATKKHRTKKWDATKPANPYAVAAIRFMLLTGWRSIEARSLRWDAVNLERGAATLADTKTGKSERALGVPAVAMLRALPRMERSPYVFPGTDPQRPLPQLRQLWNAARYAAKLEGVRLHDIRHTAASHAIGGGLSLYVTGKLLGHKDQATTQRYAHLADDVQKRAADDMANTIAAALEGTTAKVLPMKRAAGAGRGRREAGARR
ncbi:MAG: site-specific integrase [Gemmatimonadetes bacterium]|nr:site-specific integrase [Gemmatimonadota bacterium]